LIAETFRTTVADIRRRNPGIDDDFLRVGQRLRVPPP
jgi:LysM repeat protein